MIMRVIVAVMSTMRVIMGIMVRTGCVVIVHMLMMRARGRMIVRLLRCQRRFGFECVQGAKERARFYPKKPGADQHDQRVANGLDHAHRVAHGLGGGADQNSGNSNQHHCGKCLQECGRERQNDAAPPGLFIGDEVGGNHRLAVARTRGMENAVGERDAHEPPERRAVALGGADQAGQFAIEQSLLAQKPAEQSGCRRLAHGGERARLRGGLLAKRGCCEQTEEQDTQNQARLGVARHGQVTDIRLAKLAPMPAFASHAADLSSRTAAEKKSSRGFATDTEHCAGALTSRT